MTEQQFITYPVKKVFLKLTIPSIFSMVFSTIYMMADGIFVGRYIGAEALAAVNLVMPILMIVFAVSNLIAVGSSVKVSTALGEGKIEHAKRLFTASMLMVIGIGLFFTVVGLLFLKPIVFFAIKDTNLAQMAYDYTRFFVYGLPFFAPLFALDNFLRACGRAKYSMFVNVLVSLLNIVLDWLFIVVMHMGIASSAIASAISMIIGAILSFIPFFTRELTLHFTKPQITLQEIGGIIFNGSSEFFSNIAGSIIAAIINAFLLTLGGNVAVASYSIMMYIDTLLYGVLYGILDAIQPAVSYNYGAKDNKRALAFFKISGIVTAAASVICFAAIMLFPQFFAGIFAQDGDTEMIKMTAVALKLYAPSYIFTWYNMLTSAFLTAMDRPKESMLIMLFRAILFPLICLFVLAEFMGVNGVFFMETVSSALTFIAAVFIWQSWMKHLKAQTI